jgi:hypothetical protein
MNTKEEFLRIEPDSGVTFDILSSPEAVQCHHEEKSWLMYEITVKHEDQEKKLRIGKAAMRQLAMLIMQGYPPKGKYTITRTGYGLQTRYSVVAVDPLPLQPQARPHWLRRFLGCFGIRGRHAR